MAIEQSSREEIIRERLRREALVRRESPGTDTSSSWGMTLINQGSEQNAIESLLFFTSPADFVPCLQSLQQEIRDVFKAADDERQGRLFEKVLGYHFR